MKSKVRFAVVAAVVLLVASPLAVRAAGKHRVPLATSLSQALPATPTSNGRAIVGFRSGIPTGVAPGTTLGGLPVLQTSKSGAFVVVAAKDLAEVRRSLEGRRDVKYIEDDVLLKALVTPNDTRYGEQYGPGIMGFPAAWDQVGFGSPSVKVAVLDSGIRRTHQDFQASRVLTGHDYVNNDATTNDDCGHGTHTAGTVGATTGNGLGVAGMSQATILPMKIIGAVGGILNVQCSGNTSGIATAIRDAADQGAKVISMSIGGGGTATLESAVDYAWGKGVTLVAASGNDGGANSVDFPGAYANVIAVGALESNKAKASYSDGGPQLDVMGPGTDVLSTYNTNNTSYSLLSGTSMATPHVSGALALALSCAPSTSNAALRDALYATAEDLGAGGRDDVFGNGLARVDSLVASLCGGGGGTTTSSSPTSSSSSSSSSTSSSVPSDPDPGAPTVTSGSTTNLSMGAGQEKFLKINVPAGKAQLKVVMTGPACSLLNCPLDSDLYTRQGARPTDSVYACRPYANGNNETCTHANPVAGYWYIRVKAYSGSGTVQIKPTIT